MFAVCSSAVGIDLGFGDLGLGPLRTGELSLCFDSGAVEEFFFSSAPECFLSSGLEGLSLFGAGRRGLAEATFASDMLVLNRYDGFLVVRD